jgi:ubiquinone/menaquinone biosynthesis C-methylase UbiE
MAPPQFNVQPEQTVTKAPLSAAVTPLPSSLIGNQSIEMVFMSMVFHHFADALQVVLECHRVLKPGGTVCLRAVTSDEIDSYPYIPFFARSGDIIRRTLQSREAILSIFAEQYFTRMHPELVRSKIAPTWSAFAEKTSYRADSILNQLSDCEFSEGMVLLREYAAERPTRGPVIEPVDFFVFSRL